MVGGLKCTVPDHRGDLRPSALDLKTRVHAAKRPVGNSGDANRSGRTRGRTHAKTSFQRVSRE